MDGPPHSAFKRDCALSLLATALSCPGEAFTVQQTEVLDSAKLSHVCKGLWNSTQEPLAVKYLIAKDDEQLNWSLREAQVLRCVCRYRLSIRILHNFLVGFSYLLKPVNMYSYLCRDPFVPLHISPYPLLSFCVSSYVFIHLYTSSSAFIYLPLP